MRIVLTGGGTAGHVTPHLAILPHLIRAGYDIHYIGTSDGIERRMMEAIPEITYHTVQSGKLRRYHDWKNFTDPFRVLKGMAEASKLMKELKPNVCFSKGGFVSVPVVIAAKRHGVPVLCHESDLTPGLANRICSRFAAAVATTFPECAAKIGKKGVMTGTPLRPELFTGSREKGLRMAGFAGGKPVLLMMGGSSGAQSVNKALREALSDLLPDFDILHITGKNNIDEDLMNIAGYAQFEFLTDDLPDALACADFILSRAGSNALCEFQALKKPMLLIPYPKGASRGDQILNAESFRARGLAHVLLQENMTPDTLISALRTLRANSDTLTAALENAPPADGTQPILKLIDQIKKPDKPKKPL